MLLCAVTPMLASYKVIKKKEKTFVQLKPYVHTDVSICLHFFVGYEENMGRSAAK